MLTLSLARPSMLSPLRLARRSLSSNATTLPCSFYRGGTSKGLLWATATLAPFTQRERDRIICSAMGSPDPDRRQIDGLGGGISSLSKTAIVGAPGDGVGPGPHGKGGGAFDATDGVDWADDVARAADPERGWDVVYRFGQVPVERTTEIDWSSTCGNLVAAVALFALHSGAVPQQRVGAHFQPEDERGLFPVRILVASSGQIIRASVPVFRDHTGSWAPDTQGNTSIAGVPGSAPGILIETPLEKHSILPTGNEVDTVTVQGQQFPVTIINAGLPTIFVPSSAIPSTILARSSLPSQTPSELDANTGLMSLLDAIRSASAGLTPFLSRTLSPSAPKICIVHPPQGAEYVTTGDVRVPADDMDLLIRAVSVGNIHRTVPATCLSALACARAFPRSTVQQNARPTREQGQIRSITVGQPAGLSSASIRVADDGVPQSIVYYRTARRIIQGLVDLPPSLGT